MLIHSTSIQINLPLIMIQGPSMGCPPYTKLYLITNTISIIPILMTIYFIILSTIFKVTMEPMRVPANKTTTMPHDLSNCPLVPRVQALETELAYYKAICTAYENGKLKAKGNNRRLTIQKINSKEIEKMKLGVPQIYQMQGYKQEQLRFSEQIDKKIKNVTTKLDHKQQGSFSKTPIIDKNYYDFENKQQEFIKVQQNSPYKIIQLSKSCYEGQSELQISSKDPQQQQQQCKQNDKSSEQPEIIKQPVDIFPQIKVIAQKEEYKKVQQEHPYRQSKPTMSLISDLCLFGCNQKGLTNLSNQKINEVHASLMFSMFNLNDKQYYDQVAKYLFPNGLYSRIMKQQRLLSEVNQILLQNVKKHSNFIYQLKSELKMEDVGKEQKELLSWINPSLKLYCISIIINDFTIVDPDPILSDKQKSPEESQKSQDQGGTSNRSTNYVPKSNRRKQSKEIKNFNIYNNKKILSIFTYYPFFQFFQSVLISIFNALKVGKLGVYQNKLQTIFQIDTNYVLSQLQSTYVPIINQINTTLMVPGLDYQFILGADLLKISTDVTKLIDACMGAWLYPVLKLFDKNTFYDVLSAILFQQQVIFVCENQHILSYTIYLFTQVLVRPFHYEHSAIYMVSYWDLLDAPTPIVLGVNKPSQWLEQTQLRDGHLYVQIGEQITLIDNRKQQKRVKSQKLKKIIGTFFKSIDRDGITFFKQKKKKDGVQYNLSSTKQEKQLSMLFISSINVFMKEQLVDVIPNQKILEKIKERFRWSNIAKNQDAATVISQQIIKQMLRMRKEKDSFVQKFMRTQIFLTYLFDLVKLDE